jgi:hypothetical protein
MHASARNTEDAGEIVEMLLKRGARIDIVNPHRKTVTDFAKEYGGPRKVELL